MILVVDLRDVILIKSYMKNRLCNKANGCEPSGRFIMIYSAMSYAGWLDDTLVFKCSVDYCCR